MPATLDTMPPEESAALVFSQEEYIMDGRTPEVQGKEADISEDGDDQWRHEVEGEPVE